MSWWLWHRGELRLSTEFNSTGRPVRALVNTCTQLYVSSLIEAFFTTFFNHTKYILIYVIKKLIQIVRAFMSSSP